MNAYQWKVGDVFSDGHYRWRVDRVVGDRAVLRSCSTEWATTILLTYAEWNEGDIWKLQVGGYLLDNSDAMLVMKLENVAHA